MIGQIRLKTQLEHQVNCSTLNCFNIVVGPKGSGKRELIKWLSKKLGYLYVEYGNKMDDIRNLIETAYTQVNPICYVVPECENMSIQAKNALLKITEEPPKNAFLFLTSSTKNDVLPTLLSRGSLFQMDGYSEQEKIEFIGKLSDVKLNAKQADIMLTCCSNLSEILEASKYDMEEFEEIILLVINKIGKSTIGNSLKITNKLKLKEDSEGYNPKIFLTALSNYIYKIKNIDYKTKLEVCNLCNNAIHKLSQNLNKQSIVDNFILELRELLK